jgi:hypothetical protein
LTCHCQWRKSKLVGETFRSFSPEEAVFLDHGHRAVVASLVDALDDLSHTILPDRALRGHVEQTLPTEGPIVAEAVEEASRHV